MEIKYYILNSRDIQGIQKKIIGHGNKRITEIDCTILWLLTKDQFQTFENGRGYDRIKMLV